jgi:hypothetical protein
MPGPGVTIASPSRTVQSLMESTLPELAMEIYPPVTPQFPVTVAVTAGPIVVAVTMSGVVEEGVTEGLEAG